MTDPRRWTDDTERPPVAELRAGLQDGARRVRPLSSGVQTQLWRQIEQRAAAGAKWDWLMAPALVLSVALVGVALWLPKPIERTEHVLVGTIADLDVTPGALLSVPEVGPSSPAGYVMSLSSGKLCAHVQHRDLAHEGPFIVQAPGLKVVVIGTRFCVEALDAQTTVAVAEGRVRVERPELPDVFVGAGETLSSTRSVPALAPVAALAAAPDPGPASPTVAPPTANTTAAVIPTDSRCPAVASLAKRADCYAALIGTDDLTAQNALFALALLSRDDLHDGPAALSYLRTYLARFPQGALAAEARQSLIAELFAEGRWPEASAEADRYLKSYAWDARAAQVALLRAGLLRRDERQRAEALAAYREILARETPAAVRDEALYGAIVSAFDVGQVAQARADVARYRSQFAQGKHAAEVEALRSR